MSDAPFAPHVPADEPIVWSGRPRQGIVLTRHDLYLVPFSLLWDGFAIFWETTVLRMNAPAPFPIFGAPFVLIGLFLIVGRFPIDAWLRGKIHYALTDRRVLILREDPFGALRALGIGRLPDVTLIAGAGGRGTIRFSQAAGFGRTMAWVWLPSLDPIPRFWDIPDARGVFAMIEDRARPR